MTIDDLQPLFRRMCMRWNQAYKAERMTIYFECFTDLDAKRMEEAINAAIKTMRHFPTPDELMKLYREMRRNEQDGKACAYCEGGWVFLKIKGENAARPCAHCHRKHIVPLVAKVGEAIFEACVKSTEDYEGATLFYSDLKNMKRMKDTHWRIPATSNPNLKVTEQY